MLALLTYLIVEIIDRCRRLRAGRDDGYSTEAVLVIALLVATAITVMGIIGAKVVNKANGINL